MVCREKKPQFQNGRSPKQTRASGLTFLPHCAPHRLCVARELQGWNLLRPFFLLLFPFSFSCWSRTECFHAPMSSHCLEQSTRRLSNLLEIWLNLCKASSLCWRTSTWHEGSIGFKWAVTKGYMKTAARQETDFFPSNVIKALALWESFVFVLFFIHFSFSFCFRIFSLFFLLFFSLPSRSASILDVFIFVSSSMQSSVHQSINPKMFEPHKCKVSTCYFATSAPDAAGPFDLELELEARKQDRTCGRSGPHPCNVMHMRRANASPLLPDKKKERKKKKLKKTRGSNVRDKRNSASLHQSITRAPCYSRLGAPVVQRRRRWFQG